MQSPFCLIFFKNYTISTNIINFKPIKQKFLPYNMWNHQFEIFNWMTSELNQMTFEPTTRSWLSQPLAWPVVSCRPARPPETWLPEVCRVELRGRAGTRAQASIAGLNFAPSVNKSHSVSFCIKNLSGS